MMVWTKKGPGVPGPFDAHETERLGAGQTRVEPNSG